VLCVSRGVFASEFAEFAEENEELSGSKNQERGGGSAGRALESRGRRRSVCSKGWERGEGAVAGKAFNSKGRRGSKCSKKGG
jgi:hypothetical protein